MDMGSQSHTSSSLNSNFICGVVEGFYGRPWTSEQRKDLFQKMKKWGMDSYLYAPKDDYKHRAFWKELYTVEETDHLSSLINVAKENGIRFIYAISPGLDIVYSSSKDVTALKRKLEQVSQLGCTSFAILFDDIDPEMSKADKEMFKSFAHAQVAVTNEVFQLLNSDKFLVCPTQYCATRAVPNVLGSEYLKTLGSKLDLRIDIMWTGGKVISKELTLESIDEISEVLCRPPVIWDNLHANDYDQKRIYLGPYSGRSPQLISRLRGVLTNPNCEYGANFVAIHTLAQWSKCTEDATKKLEVAMSSDAKLETENEEGNHVPENLSPHVYHPVVALKAALGEWLHEFKKTKEVWGPIVKPQILAVPVPVLQSVNTCIALPTSTQTTITTSIASSGPQTETPAFPMVNCTASDISALVENTQSTFSTSMNPVMNSLAAEDKIICTTDPLPPGQGNGVPDHSTNIQHNITATPITGLEPMEVSIPPSPSSSQDKMILAPLDNLNKSDDIAMDAHEDGMADSAPPSEMALDTENETCNGSNKLASSSAASSTMQIETQDDDDLEKSDDEAALTVDDLHLLCDLFYLPFEHGTQGLQILHEFQWLKTNANVVAGISTEDKSKPEVVEWYDRASKFEGFHRSLTELVGKLNNVSNRELLYEIYPYIWDMRGVVSLLNSYVKWLGFSKGWREAFCSGDQEPWVIRGGLTSELQRLIPLDRGTDLYIYKAPETPSSRVYTIRNYRPSDEPAVYKVITMTLNDGLNAADDFIGMERFPGDFKVGGFLNLIADLSFVVEDENEVIVGVAVGCINGKEFRNKLNTSWIPILRERYPLSAFNGMEFGRELVTKVHSDLVEVPEDITSSHPAELRLAFVAPLLDPSVPKRLLTCVLAAFRANGVFGCFIEVSSREKYTVELYKKLGFVELSHPDYLGRSF